MAAFVAMTMTAALVSCGGSSNNTGANTDSDQNIPVIAYSAPSYSLIRNVASSITPTIGGSTPTSCYALPTLPAGLSINYSDCAISGTPTTEQSNTSYVITAINADGTGQTTINFEVKAPGINVSAVTTTFAENAGLGSFTVALNTRPNGNVVIDVSSLDTTEAKVSKDAGTTKTPTLSLTFTASDWNTAQTVTLVGQNDYIIDGDQSVTINIRINSALTADATGYASVNPVDILVTVDDSPAVGQKLSYNIDGFSFFNMVYVPPKKFNMKVDDSGSGEVTNGYFIGETETTYELWNTVRLWGASHGYSFANVGIMGDGTNDTVQHPVANVKWRDAVVWANALTEYSNAMNGTSLLPVYYMDAAYTTLQKNSSDANCGVNINWTVGSCDFPYVKGANGFRLPTGNEWELAARYKGDLNNDGDIMDAGEFYSGNFASGGTGPTMPTVWILGRLFSYDINTSNVAVYNEYDNGYADDSAAPVKSKLPNALGLYDMSGNVWEWNFDLALDQVTNPGWRVFRGGSWQDPYWQLYLGIWGWWPPNGEQNNIGFRVARSY